MKSSEGEVRRMLSHPEKVISDKEIKGSVENDHTVKLLEKEELGIIFIFTAIVIAALLLTYIL